MLVLGFLSAVAFLVVPAIDGRHHYHEDSHLANRNAKTSDINLMKKSRDLHGDTTKQDKNHLNNQETKDSGPTLHYEDLRGNNNPSHHVKPDIFHQKGAKYHERTSENEEVTPTHSDEVQNGKEIHVMHEGIEINHKEHKKMNKDNEGHLVHKTSQNINDSKQRNELTQSKRDTKERQRNIAPQREMNMEHHQGEHVTRLKAQSPEHLIYGGGRYFLHFMKGHHKKDHFNREKGNDMMKRLHRSHHRNQEKNYHGWEHHDMDQRYLSHQKNRDNRHYDYNDHFEDNRHNDASNQHDNDDHMDNYGFYKHHKDDGINHGHDDVVPRNRHIRPSWHHTEHQGSRYHHNHRSRRDISSQDHEFYMVNNYNIRPLHPIVLMKDFEVEDDDDIEISGGRNKRNPNNNKGLPCDSSLDGQLIYDKKNCRLCQCSNGRFVCERIPTKCRTSKYDNKCSFTNGDVVHEGTTHYDGCNYCACRKREWTCTRLRCHSAGYAYTNYEAVPDHIKGSERPYDTCMDCDGEPLTPVCAPDWRTYRSLCHARFCGGYDIDEITQGPCQTKDPCQHSKCGKHEVCIPFYRGPCLNTKTRDGYRINCEQHHCVLLDGNCPAKTLPQEVVCGEDGQTYPSACHMAHNSIAFAYRGPCRPACMTGNTQVCGTDGVTLQSDCHAHLFGLHVDYPGACEVIVAKPELVQEDKKSVYVNRRCSKVQEMARCLSTSCKDVVIPEGSCCPVCGASVSIRVDRAIVSDLIYFRTLSTDTDFSRLDVLQSFLRSKQDTVHVRKCRITVDFTDRNDISVVFVPRQPRYISYCQQAAKLTVDKVNSQSNTSNPLEVLMASAVFVEPLSQPKSRERRRYNTRMKRDIYLEHNSNSDGVALAPLTYKLTGIWYITYLFIYNW